MVYVWAQLNKDQTVTFWFGMTFKVGKSSCFVDLDVEIKIDVLSFQLLLKNTILNLLMQTKDAPRSDLSSMH